MKDKKGLKIMHLTWEFPPYKVGGIGSVVEDLSLAQARQGARPIVVTCTFDEKTEGYENYNGVHVFRFNADGIPADDVTEWTSQMNLLMQTTAAEVIQEVGGVDIIHVHDWLSAIAGITLKHIYRIPLIGDIHALEKGRYGHIRGPIQEFIHSMEGKLVFEAWRVICHSEFMKREVVAAFGTPWDKIDVVPNAVYIDKFLKELPEDKKAEIKNRYALPEEKIVTYVGRLVWEKGVDVLIGAVPMILAQHPEAKFVIGGKGYMRDRLEKLAHDLGVAHKVLFLGFVPDEELKELLAVSDVFVVPSRYEPFGITPLEAMTSKTPVVVSDTGGLSEIVEHEHNGIKVYPGMSDSLAWGVNRILGDPGLANKLVENALEKLRNVYDWDNVARQTLSIYERVLEEYKNVDWKPVVDVMKKRYELLWSR